MVYTVDAAKHVTGAQDAPSKSAVLDMVGQAYVMGYEHGKRGSSTIVLPNGLMDGRAWVEQRAGQLLFSDGPAEGQDEAPPPPTP